MVLRIGVPLEQLGVAARELVLHRAELLLELHKVLGGPAGVLLDGPIDVDEQLLLEEAHAGAARERDRAGIGCVEADDDPHERRLPRAVRADQSRAIAVGEVEAHLAEQHAVGEAPARRLDREDAHRRDRARGARWQRGQWYVLRPPMTLRLIEAPQRSQGSLARS